MRPQYDIAVIGAGHNGLVCAFYLARAGLKVRMFERRSVVGGAAVTETFAPGFRNSVASYTVSLLNPRVIADMDLHGRGLRILERPVSNFLPLEGDGLEVGGGLERTQAEFARFSARDAERLPAYLAMLEGVADVLRDLALRAPPNAGGGLSDLARLMSTGVMARRLGIERQRDVLDLFAKSAAEVLRAWFESEPVQAVFGFDSVVGAWASPETPGSAYVLLHHVFGEVNGKKGAWGHAVGGMGAITQAMRAACEAEGVEMTLDAPVQEVLIENGAAVGVRLEDGQTFTATRVVSNLNPRLLFTKLVPESAVDADFTRRIRAYRCGSGTFRMNVALSALPRFACRPEPGPHLSSGIVIAPSLAYMDEAFRDSRAHGWSRRPIVEMLIPSTVDDSLAPPGAHVASLFCQQFAPELPDGRSWDEARETCADLIIDTVDAWAPGFKATVVGRQILSPLDLERTFGLLGGDIMHGSMGLDQLWSARPVLGAGAYRAPVRGLYLCGAGSHPGGGVTGAPGLNAAREILRDARGFRPRLWAASAM